MLIFTSITCKYIANCPLYLLTSLLSIAAASGVRQSWDKVMIYIFFSSTYSTMEITNIS